jgi:hypothetical protein
MLFDPYYIKGGGRIGILESGKADQGYGLSIGVQFFGALGSEANIIWATPPENITLINTEDVEDSEEEQEVAVTEWTQGANPMSCKWVEKQGPAKGFDFDESKVE